MSNIDYTAVDIFDKRVYSELPYLVLPEETYRINLNWDSDYEVKAFVYKKDELFGDPIPLNLAGMVITFNLFNSDNILVCVGEGSVSDLNTSEIEYVIKPLDIPEPGRYYGHFILTDVEGRSIMLPNPRQKQRIVLNII